MPNTRPRSTALTFRLDALATYIQRYGFGSHPLDVAMMLARQAVEEIDNIHAELIERCETMERMASGGPCWLAVFFDDHPGGISAIHFKTDAELIYGMDTRLTCVRCGQTFPERKLSAHLATCE